MKRKRTWNKNNKTNTRKSEAPIWSWGVLLLQYCFCHWLCFLDCYICCLLAQFLELILHFELLLTLVLLWNQRMTLIRSWHMALYNCVLI